ncbi:hypothetical protein DL89DRAFT_263965 [Linderina pennispora]|uniref:Uncharacterized protein n=1 Tax=Linderina pennispora TaxID=61395 RepID=A0A1Y1WKF6_9FUNG|nr:uncharacterized protein DL89DRAFT_263965 [Linderina pennispora]ORX73962.1 hypothetical protein DL89DRAFT_263965 [Linderina pennispora]
MTNTPTRKRPQPHIVVGPLQVPTSVRMPEQVEGQPASLAGDAISRAQYKPTVHLISSATGNPAPLTTRFCSAHAFGLESLSIWNDEVQTREQWGETDRYAKYIARQLADNNALTGNLHWAMLHFLVHMRCLRTLDFLGDVSPVLRNLQFVLRLVFKGIVSAGTVDLIMDKYAALEDGEVRSHAFRQVLADTRPLHQQVLHYVVLATAYAFHQELLAMLSDIFASQVYAEGVADASNMLIDELLMNVGSSTAFNIGRTPAEDIVDALLLYVGDPPPVPTGHSLVSSAYSYFFARQYAVQTKSLEQAALERAVDAPEGRSVDCKVSFRRLFEKAVEEIQSVEWAVLIQITLIIPLLKRIAAATALPIPAASSHVQPASTSSGHHQRKHSVSKGEKSGYSAQKQAPTTILTYTNRASTARWWRHTGLVARQQALAVAIGATLPSPGAKLRQGVPAALALDTVPSGQQIPHPMRRQPLSQCIVAEALRVHAQVLAILINVLNGATETPTAVAQKLVKLFEMIHRRSARLSGMGSMLVGEERQELEVYEQTLGALLALFCRLAYSNNAQFIYCLLQARELVSSTGRGDDRGVVGVAYFHARISSLSNPLAKDILGVIQSVVGKEAPGSQLAAEEVRVAGVARVAPEREWTGFMLPLVGLVAVEGRTPLLEEFESLVL